MTAEPPKGRVGMTQVEVSNQVCIPLNWTCCSGKRVLERKSFSREQEERSQREF